MKKLILAATAAMLIAYPSVAAAPPFDTPATVAYMQGKLKSTGSTGALFDLIRSGTATTALTQLASRP